MKNYYRVTCRFDAFLKARAVRKMIESSADLDGCSNISPADRAIVFDQIKRIEIGTGPSFPGGRRQIHGELRRYWCAREESNHFEERRKGYQGEHGGPCPQLSSSDVTIHFSVQVIWVASFIYCYPTRVTNPSFTISNPNNCVNCSPSSSMKIPPWSFKTTHSAVVRREQKILPSDFTPYFLQISRKRLVRFTLEIHIWNRRWKRCRPMRTLITHLRDLGQLTCEQDHISLLRKITGKSTVNDLRMFIRFIQYDLVNTLERKLHCLISRLENHR